MYNKKLIILLGSILSLSIYFLGSFGFAVNLDYKIDLGNNWYIIDSDYFNKKISTVHFNDMDNDYGGFLYFNQGSTGNFNVVKDDVGYECNLQIGGFYFNEQRGDVIWPLDKDTAEKFGMESGVVSGGIYTRCRLSGYQDELLSCNDKINEDDREDCEKKVKDKFVDNHGYFGEVDHQYSGSNMRLVIGTDYSTGTDGSFVSTGGLIPSLVRIGNKYPVGFLYDHKGGLGFVGCKVSVLTGLVNECKNNLTGCFELNSGLTGVDSRVPYADCTDGVGSSKDTLLSIVIDGVVGLGKDSKNDGYVGNLSDDKMQLFSSVDINNTKLINYARQKAEILCRGKWETTVPTSSIAENVVCIKNSSDGVDATSLNLSGKVVIVKSGNVIVEPNKDKVYNIFVDGGNLLIKENNTLSVILRNGFSNSSSVSDFTGYSEFLVRFKMEDLDYGALNADFYSYIGSDCEDILDPIEKDICKIFGDPMLTLTFLVDYNGELFKERVALASIIKGNFIVNGNVKSNGGGLLNNRYFIYGKFTTKDTLSELEEVFGWRCKNGKATDGYYCIQDATNPYSYAALAIIDQNYESPLLK